MAIFINAAYLLRFQLSSCIKARVLPAPGLPRLHNLTGLTAYVVSHVLCHFMNHMDMATQFVCHGALLKHRAVGQNDHQLVVEIVRQ